MLGEYSPLLQASVVDEETTNRGEYEVPVKSIRSRRTMRLALGTIIIAVLGFIYFSGSMSPSIINDVSTYGLVEMSRSSKAVSSTKAVSSLIAFNDDYDRWNDMADLYGWEFVAEPLRTVRFLKNCVLFLKYSTHF